MQVSTSASGWVVQVGTAGHKLDAFNCPQSHHISVLVLTGLVRVLCNGHDVSMLVHVRVVVGRSDLVGWGGGDHSQQVCSEPIIGKGQPS